MARQVTVKVEGDLGTSEVILSPGGGLGPYELKQVLPRVPVDCD